MKFIFDLIERYPTAAGLAGSSLGLLFPQVRRFLWRAWRWMSRAEIKQKEKDETLAMRAAIMDKLGTIEAAIGSTATRIEAIEKEMKFNGGRTIKDMLFLLFNYRRHDFWRLGIPAMELDGEGQVTLVSEAACKLFGVVNPDDLKRRSWLRFIERGTVDDFLHDFRATAQSQSEFSATIRIRTPDGHERGEWELRAAPISEENASSKIYTAHLAPVDEIAARSAGSINWSFFRCKNCIRSGLQEESRRVCQTCAEGG